jgi:hypothetical protein
MSEDGHIQAYVLSVGGFLGVFERYVAVDPSAVKVGYPSRARRGRRR